MYIYKKPQVPGPAQGTRAEAEPGVNVADLSPSPVPGPPPLSSHSRNHQRQPSSAGTAAHPPTQTPAIHQRHPLADARRSLPLSFPPIFFGAGNASSTSLVPSTAEGRPIPLDDSTAASRTSALRELNNHYPSPVLRHRYTKSSAPQSSTYSQPVIVRTYSGPSPSQHPYAKSHSGTYRQRDGVRSVAKRVPLAATTASSTASISPSPFGSVPASGPAGPRLVVNHVNHVKMPRDKPKKKSPWSWIGGGEPDVPEEARLPPLEAYSFKGLMANMQAQDSDVDADLDRIAEICARSRYSLSNQYEVHMKPHGSGTTFLAGARTETASSSRRKKNESKNQALTLQAVPSDDESSRAQRKRRSVGRRRSIAYGTLETIMSSSRSSEEDKTKKKSAQEIAEDVRGRVAMKKPVSSPGPSRSGSGSGSTRGHAAPTGQDPTGPQQTPSRRKSVSFAHAVIDTTRHTGVDNVDTASPRNSAAALVGEPALPQTSGSHLEIRTAPDPSFSERNHVEATQMEAPAVTNRPDDDTLAFPRTPIPQSSEDTGISATGLLSGLSSWMPWKLGSETANPSHAEGSLRSLLQTVDGKQNKGKGMQRNP